MLSKGEVLLPKAEHRQLEPQFLMCRITSSRLGMGRAVTIPRDEEDLLRKGVVRAREQHSNEPAVAKMME